MSDEVHAIAKLTSHTHHRIVPQDVIDDVVEVLAQRDAEENELRQQLADMKIRAERAEFRQKQAEEDLSDALGQIQILRVENRAYRIRLGIDD